MSNKFNNKTKQNEFLKRKLTTIIITYGIFAIIVFILALLKKYSIISSDFYLIPFYFIMAIIAFSIMVILVCQMDKVCRKKELGKSLCLGLVGIFLLVAFGISIDVRKELIDFSNNSTKTEAFVYKDVQKKIRRYKEDNCVGGVHKGIYCVYGDYKTYYTIEYYYKVQCIYPLEYKVNNETYTSVYQKNEGGEFSSEQSANSYEPKYKKGDYITIYYNNNNPDDVRENIALSFGIVYFFEGMAILFQAIYFIKNRKYIKEVIK